MAARPEWPRALALLAGVGLLGSGLSVLYEITNVVGGTEWLTVAALLAFVGATAARTLPLRTGLGVGGLLLALGVSGHLLSLPNTSAAVTSLRVLRDLAALVFGDLTLLRIVRADLWAIGIAPAPVFVTWYLLLRRKYAFGAWVGGLTLGFFLITGDASRAVALCGVTSALAVLGFGTLDRSRASWSEIRDLGIVLAAAVVFARLARPVTAEVFSPAGDASFSSESGPSGAATIEGSLHDAPGRIDIQGSISLSSTVRFTVTADRAALWHAAAYDRFTGDGWVRSGDSNDYDGSLGSPPGKTENIEQTFVAEASVETMPAAWNPVSVGSDVAARTRVTDLGSLQPGQPFDAGESYSVTSERPVRDAAALREATGSIPDAIRERYLELPASTPARIGRLAAELTADTETAFEKTVTVEQWLENNREYSLDVNRPDGNVADAFVFRMDRGYCVYFATAMTVMLRTLDVPARFAVGYSTGQPVSDTEWVVRGFNSHAWVEVYFPEIGWVSFDPTPSAPRQAVRRRRLQTVRQSNLTGVDTARTRLSAARSTAATPDNATAPPAANGSTGAPPATPSSNQSQVDERRGTVTVDAGAVTPDSLTDPESESAVTRRSLLADLSGPNGLALVAGAAGLALGASKFGLLQRGRRAVDRYWQPPTGSPRQDVERAFDRVEAVLARQYRSRRDGETRREYVAAVQQRGTQDDRLDRLVDLYEHAVYRGDVSRQRADEAREIATQIGREDSLLPKLRTETNR
ncbi:MAG: DUF3488 and DUF4129 domain-containing transglutaminase family protein [Halobellus sp.]